MSTFGHEQNGFSGHLMGFVRLCARVSEENSGGIRAPQMQMLFGRVLMLLIKNKNTVFISDFSANCDPLFKMCYRDINVMHIWVV